MAERFPGGVREFAQFVAQLPEDALNDVILQFQMGGLQQEDGGMPGDFVHGGGIGVDGDDRRGELQDVEMPGEVEEGLDGDENDEDEEDEDEEASPVSDFFRSYRVSAWELTVLNVTGAYTWAEEHHWQILGNEWYKPKTR